jgi:hypothetical protein
MFPLPYLFLDHRTVAELPKTSTDNYAEAPELRKTIFHGRVQKEVLKVN